jgi:hypothetical protein
MTSQVNPNNIDGTYPVAGQDNDSQGFRDNFTNIRNNLTFVKAEIEDIQNKAIFKTALNNTTLDNEFAGNIISNPSLTAWRETYNNIGSASGSVTVNFANGNFQKITMAGAMTLSFSFPANTNNQLASIKLWIVNPSASYTLTLPSAVTLGDPDTIAGLSGTSPPIITFTSAEIANNTNYLFEFFTVDGGTTIGIKDLIRNRDVDLSGFTISGNLSLDNVTASGSLSASGTGIFEGNILANSNTSSSTTTTGALVVRGGAGITGDIRVGGTVYATSFVGTGVGGNVVAPSGTDSTSSTTGALVVVGGAGVSGNLFVTGNAVLGSSTTSNVVVAATTTSISTTTGALVVSGGIGIAGNIFSTGNAVLGSSTTSNVVVAATTTSTSTTTGALVVSGGVGIAGNLNLPAGSTSIVPISFGVGATGGNITGVQQGAFEANLGVGATGTASNVLYFAPTNVTSSGEALIPATHYYVLGGNIDLWGKAQLNRVNSITEIPLFGNLAAGSPESNAGLWIGNVMLAAGTTYEMDMKIHCEASAALTSSNIALKFLGNATVSYLQYDTVFVPARGTTSTAASTTHFYNTGILQGYGAAATTIAAAGTPSNFMIRAKGIFRINGQGTLCPTLNFGVAQSTQTIATLAGSYIKWTPVGTAANIAIGTSMGAPWAGGVGY